MHKHLTLIATVATFALPALAQQPEFKLDRTTRSISITSTAKVTNLADVASVHIGFIAYGPDKDAAYANGSRVSNAIIDTLKKTGVPADAIESVNQQVVATPEYQLEKLSPTDKQQHAWQVTQSWTVRANAADGAKVLDVATKAGANQSGEIDWSLHDSNAAQAAAATKAMQQARAQADAMASGLNVKLGVLLYANNSVESQPVRPEPQAMRLMAKMANAPVPLAINARQIETTAMVTAVFEIN
ncbi:SIMPL domain-containing protein [Granulicella cerasi]|uniref:SIMPL domain-containing protein n=1 Tax=Granulicella cerasi TaxID=741063 RepID=A0ABW1ZA19_9BACT|nr:SIMPL domain-containing protein [Granulicella cerasi]